MAANDTPKALVEALDPIRGTRGPKPGSLDVLESKQVSRVRTISKTATSSLSESPKGGIVLAGWPVLRDPFVYQQLTEDFDARSRHE